MNFFPKKRLEFKLNLNEVNALDKLNEVTEISSDFFPVKTNKDFIGKIENQNIKLIPNTDGKKSFCIINGSVKSNVLVINIEVHAFFKRLLMFMLLMLFVLISITYDSNKHGGFLLLFILLLSEFLIFRFIILTKAFSVFSKKPINQIRKLLNNHQI